MATLPYYVQASRRTGERYRIDCSAMVSINETQQELIILRAISTRGMGLASTHPFAVNKIITKEA